MKLTNLIVFIGISYFSTFTARKIDESGFYLNSKYLLIEIG